MYLQNGSTPFLKTIPARRAILAANLETAINALWDARPALGDKISVVGAGVLGSLCAWLASQITGCEVELIDINPNKAWLGKTFGITFRQAEKRKLG